MLLFFLSCRETGTNQRTTTCKHVGGVLREAFITNTIRDVKGRGREVLRVVIYRSGISQRFESGFAFISDDEFEMFVRDVDMSSV